MRVSLQLFVTGRTPRSTRAVDNLRLLTDRYLPGQCDISIIDITKDPAAAAAAQILATPTLIRPSPLPSRRVIGDLSDFERVATLLGLTSGRSQT